MIPRNEVISWGVDHPWPELNQIEQDLLLSQAICEIAKDPLLSNELALRGGTAFHKLFLPRPYRYSEDLDYVRTTEGNIGKIMRRLTDLGKELGYTVNTKMGVFPKVIWRTISNMGTPLKIKIEINTQERNPIKGFNFIEHSINSDYYSNKTIVRTFYISELMATKLRALYQRSKGRDLFDLWIAINELNIDIDEVLNIFEFYRPKDLNNDTFIENLKYKLKDKQFLNDVTNLLRYDASNYDALTAGNYLLERIKNAKHI